MMALIQLKTLSISNHYYRSLFGMSSQQLQQVYEIFLAKEIYNDSLLQRRYENICIEMGHSYFQDSFNVVLTRLDSTLVHSEAILIYLVYFPTAFERVTLHIILVVESDRDLIQYLYVFVKVAIYPNFYSSHICFTQ